MMNFFLYNIKKNIKETSLIKIFFDFYFFLVLQECATDSEELIYPMRAPSACSAPDLLLTGNDSQHLTTSISTQSSSGPNGQESAPVISSKGPVKKEAHSQKSAQDNQQTKGSKMVGVQGSKTPESQDGSRVRLEEFTCDVSVEDGNVPQPLQFSFTLYDLDGHGKITKDDIAGIVSTIYDSIGKTVVVPHYGKKTINVRLTMSPDSKNTTPQTEGVERTSKISVSKKLQLTPRRRYRPRKLLSDEGEDDDDLDDGESSTTSDNVDVAPSAVRHKQNNSEVHNKIHNSATSPLIVIDNNDSSIKINNSNLCNRNSELFNNNNKNTVYESINNLKCCNKLENIVTVKNINNNKSENLLDICKACSSIEQQQVQDPATINYTIKHHKQVSSSKKKKLRKSRSRRQRVSISFCVKIAETR